MAYQLQDDYKFNEVNQEYITTHVDNMVQTITYMNTTINDFRDFFKPYKDKSPFSPVLAINRANKMLGKRYQAEKVEITVIGEERIKILGVINEFQQVIINMFNNSVDAFKGNDIKDRKILAQVSENNENIYVTIKDNAGGIPQENLKSVFDSYFTTKGDDNGTGIGLYMSRVIVEDNLGGEIKVENQDGGAKFTMTFSKAI